MCRGHQPRTHTLGVHQSDRLGAPSMSPELLVRRGLLSDYLQRPCNLLPNIQPLLKFHAFRRHLWESVADSGMTIYASDDSDRHDSKQPRNDSGPHAATSCGKCVRTKLRNAWRTWTHDGLLQIHRGTGPGACHTDGGLDIAGSGLLISIQTGAGL